MNEISHMSEKHKKHVIQQLYFQNSCKIKRYKRSLKGLFEEKHCPQVRIVSMFQESYDLVILAISFINQKKKNSPLLAVPETE